MASAATEARPYTAEENWSNVLLGSLPDVGGWHGALGRWCRFAADGKTVLSLYKGVRLFRDNGDGSYDQTNLHDEVAYGCEPRSDGTFVKSWHCTKEQSCQPDGWHHPFQSLRGPCRWRGVAVTPAASATMSFALPLPHFLAEMHPPPPVWGGEVFLRSPDQGRSWSGFPMYDVKTGDFKSILFIDEFSVHEPPSEPFRLDRPELMTPPGPALPRDPENWLHGDDWSGVSRELLYDTETESFLRVPDQSAEWLPPPPGNELTRLPDSIYMSYPEALPTEPEEVPADGIVIEIGGRTSNTSFSRAVLTWRPSGELQSVRFDEFTLS